MTLPGKLLAPLLCLAFLACLVTACGGDSGGGTSAEGEKCGLTIGLDLSEINTTDIGKITIQIAQAGGNTIEEREFGDEASLSSYAFYLPLGNYTVKAITSKGYSGSTSVTLNNAETRRVTIRLSGSGQSQPVLRLSVSLPDNSLIPFEEQTGRNGQALRRRVIADIFPAGSDERLTRSVVMANEDPAGKTLLELPLDKGTYDIRLWSDYADAEGGASPYYVTEDLTQVKIRREGYEACSDRKDAAYAMVSGLTIGEADVETDVSLQRPLAKFHLVATDLREYAELKDVPPLQELTVSVAYEGFFPCSFNVETGKPNDSTEGLSFTCQPSWQADEEGNVTLASDWVLVNGTESTIHATISIISADGKTVSRTRNVAIHYKRGQLTTVSGNFLTAGHGGGGANIDTSWDDNTFEVEF